jgi:hypothetical protein
MCDYASAKYIERKTSAFTKSAKNGLKQLHFLHKKHQRFVFDWLKYLADEGTVSHNVRFHSKIHKCLNYKNQDLDKLSGKNLVCDGALNGQ